MSCFSCLPVQRNKSGSASGVEDTKGKYYPLPTSAPFLHPANPDPNLPKLIPHPLYIPAGETGPRIVRARKHLHPLHAIALLGPQPQIPVQQIVFSVQAGE